MDEFWYRLCLRTSLGLMVNLIINGNKWYLIPYNQECQYISLTNDSRGSEGTWIDMKGHPPWMYRTKINNLNVINLQHYKLYANYIVIVFDESDILINLLKYSVSWFKPFINDKIFNLVCKHENKNIEFTEFVWADRNWKFCYYGLSYSLVMKFQLRPMRCTYIWK